MPRSTTRKPASVPSSKPVPSRRLSPAARIKAKKAFLTALRETGIVRDAAECARIGRHCAYDWRHADPEFAAAWDVAVEDANDVLRAEIWRRAVTGWDEVTTTITESELGTRTETKRVRRHSDAVLAMLAKGRLPEMRDRLDVTTAGEALPYAHILASPELTELAARLAESAGHDPGGAGADSDERPV